MVNEPVAAAAVVETVSVAVPPAVTDVGFRLTVTPDGAPLADRVTCWAVPEATDVDTVEVVEPPAVTEPDAGLSPMAKSSDACAGVNVHWLAEPEQLPATTFVPEARTHFWPVWMSEMVPFGFTDHCCVGPPVQVARTTFPLDIAAQRSLMMRNAPWNMNRCSAVPSQAAVLSWVPLVALLFGSSRHWPFEPFFYWPTV